MEDLSHPRGHDIPVHDFELLVQPFCLGTVNTNSLPHQGIEMQGVVASSQGPCIQVLAVGDHSSHTYLVRWALS